MYLTADLQEILNQFASWSIHGKENEQNMKKPVK